MPTPAWRGPGRYDRAAAGVDVDLVLAALGATAGDPPAEQDGMPPDGSPAGASARPRIWPEPSVLPGTWVRSTSWPDYGGDYTCSASVPPRVVMEIIGHSTLEMTMHAYGHGSLDTQRNTLGQLGDLLDQDED